MVVKGLQSGFSSVARWLALCGDNTSSIHTRPQDSVSVDYNNAEEESS
jgi:hypothetical protein